MKQQRAGQLTNWNWLIIIVVYLFSIEEANARALHPWGWGRGVRLHAINLSAPSKAPQNTPKNLKPIMHNAVSTGKNCAKTGISHVDVPKMAVSQGVYGKMYGRHVLWLLYKYVVLHQNNFPTLDYLIRTTARIKGHINSGPARERKPSTCY